MATLDLYIDTNVGQIVNGFTNSSPVSLPLLVQGDTLNMRVWLLAHTATFPIQPPFTFIGNTDITLELAIGTRPGQIINGVPVVIPTIYTQQFTWTTNGDQNNPYFSAQLSMNTGPISSAVQTGPAPAYLEIKYLKAGVPTTVLSMQVTILPAVITGSTIPVPPSGTPLSAEAAAAMFLQHDIMGPIILRNNTGQAIQLSVGADGALKEDQLS